MQGMKAPTPRQRLGACVDLGGYPRFMPLLLAAAVTETYVTPVLMGLCLGA